MCIKVTVFGQSHPGRNVKISFWTERLIVIFVRNDFNRNLMTITYTFVTRLPKKIIAEHFALIKHFLFLFVFQFLLVDIINIV